MRPLLLAAALAALCGCSRTPPLVPLAWEAAPDGSPDLSRLGCVAAQVPVDPVRRARLVADLGALGVSQVRWELGWPWVEPAKGVFDFSFVDASLADLAAAGLEPILTVEQGNPLYSTAGAANGNDSAYPPDDPADFARFAGAVAARHGAPGRVFEVWNEENAGYRFWKPKADPVAYARLLSAASVAIKAACPLCLVIVGAPVTEAYPTVPAGVEFLRDVREALSSPLLSDQFDGQGVHPYLLYPPCSPPEGGPNVCELWKSRTETPVVVQLRTISAVLGHYLLGVGYFPLPAYVTEIGWPTAKSVTHVGEVTEELQARWLSRSFLLAAAEGTRSVCWWTWSDDARSGQFPPEGDFGLVRQDGSRKPAFDAFADLLHELRVVAFVRDRAPELGLRAGEHALLFQLTPGRDGPPRLGTFLWREESADARAIAVRLHGPSMLRTVAGSAPALALSGPEAVVALTEDAQVVITAQPGGR